jgi:tetratricopeptide (TPR) repeat protein
MRTAATLLALALSFSSSARAQDDDPEVSARRERAMHLFEESRTHYDAGRFDTAAELLAEAYDLQPDPILLYNMARAYESGGRMQEAVDAYARYLDDAGEVRDRGAIETRIATLREQLAREEELERRGEEAITTPTPPPAENRQIEPAPWIVLGIGVVGIGAGFVLGALSQDAHSQASESTIHRDALALQQNAYDFASGANVAFSVGGAIALIGAIWGILTLVL